MSIQKINIGGEDVEIEDASARTNITNITSEVNTLDGRVTTLENNSGGGGGGSEWVELTTINGQAEITQEFSEIRLLAKSLSVNLNYSVTYSYDNTIFHNNRSKAPTYMICGNPIAHNFGCKFQYLVTVEGKQYVCVDECYNGGGKDTTEFRAWIKPVPSVPQ